MTLGRSPTLSLSAARAGGVLTYALFATDQTSFPIPAFFTHSYQLFDILHEILTSLYREGSKGSLGLEMLSHISRLERELDRWTRALPNDLSLLSPSPSLSQAHFLRQRYLQVLMILLRPGLSSIIKSTYSLERDLEEATTWYCASRCIEAATEMADISILQSQADAQGTSVAPWWYNVQFCYNAGASLLAARLSGKIAEKLGTQRLDESLGKCITTLKSYGSRCPTASRCLSAFSSVAEKAGYAFQCAAADMLEARVDFDAVDLDNFVGFPTEDNWSLNWTSTSSTIFDQFGLLDDLIG